MSTRRVPLIGGAALPLAAVLARPGLARAAAESAREDQWIDARMVASFEASMREAGKTVTSHWHEARHGFANPTTARYDEAYAQLARERTVAFLDGGPSGSALVRPGIASAA